ncbi:MAG: flavin reductase [Oscillospiraceae bacterium]|nr:flavin reductase [Oscillospiraceae bacterium]
MTNFKSIVPYELSIKPVHLFGGATPLLCAGAPESFNCMTIGWGSVGCVWNRPYASVFVRLTRYTHQFMEKQRFFSINCFGGHAKGMLTELGSKSGRDIDKMHYPGLTPVFSYDAPCFEEASFILICKKMYAQMMQPDLLVGEYKTDVINELYSSGESRQNFHMIYYGEIIHALERD